MGANSPLLAKVEFSICYNRGVKIKNETAWNTAHLRHFAREIAKAELEPSQRKGTTVVFKHNGKKSCPWVHGHVYVNAWRDRSRNSGAVTIFLPRPWDEAEDNHQQLAMVLAHEFHHIATDGRGAAWEQNKRGSARWGHGYRSRGTFGAYRKFYEFTLRWSLDPK